MSDATVCEVTEVHTRLLKVALEVEESRDYWRQVTPGVPARAEDAFSAWWFGDRSLDRVATLLANFRARFDAFPEALRVLHGWPAMGPDTRAAICHWHLQLSDPLYRAFTGEFLVARREGTARTVSRDVVVDWVTDQGPGRWTLSTRVQFASKLLSAASAAGLVDGVRDPRPLAWPRVPDDALAYLLHLLRGVQFEGSLLRNPYLRSVGLDEGAVLDRLRLLPGITARRVGATVELSFDAPDLASWASTARSP